MVEFLATWHVIYAPKLNLDPSPSPSHLGSLIQLPSPLNNSSSLCWQLCDKSGNTVHTCSWRFDATFFPTHGQRHPQVNYASSSSSASQDWHLDSGATHHIMANVNTIRTPINTPVLIRFKLEMAKVCLPIYYPLCFILSTYSIKIFYS